MRVERVRFFLILLKEGTAAPFYRARCAIIVLSKQKPRRAARGTDTEYNIKRGIAAHEKELERLDRCITRARAES